MKINLGTGKLYTDSGQLLKQMACPRNESWQAMVQVGSGGVRLCSQCQHEVTDITLKTEKEVSEILQINPSACLHIDLERSNTRVISHAP
jgi:hypothetical protein